MERILNQRSRILYPAAAILMALAMLVLCMRAGAEPTYSDKTDLASIEDSAGLLSDEEKEELLSLAAEIAKDTKMEIRLVTTDNAQGKSAMAYAEDYFESLSQSFSGGCYLIDMDNRQFRVATYGDLQYYLTDNRVSKMVDNATEYARSSEWEKVLESMLSDTKAYIKEGVKSGTRIYDEETGTYKEYVPPKSITPLEAAMSFGVGLLGFLALFFSIKRSYEMKVPETNDYSVSENVHMNLKVNRDHLIDTHVNRVRIQNDNHDSSSGGPTTSVHTTSGGHSAGGGGGSF